MWLCRNAMVFEKQINVIFVGYFLNFALAPYLGYSPGDRFAGYGCSGLTVLGEGGQGVFYPDTCVMYGRAYARKRRARDIRRAAERAQRVTNAAQGLAEPSSG